MLTHRSGPPATAPPPPAAPAPLPPAAKDADPFADLFTSLEAIKPRPAPAHPSSKAQTLATPHVKSAVPAYLSVDATMRSSDPPLPSFTSPLPASSPSLKAPAEEAPPVAASSALLLKMMGMGMAESEDLY